jgi:hypothetical protein
MAWPRWRHTLNEAERLAVKAIDEYNCSTGHYGDFIGTMVRAWLCLLQAEFLPLHKECPSIDQLGERQMSPAWAKRTTVAKPSLWYCLAGLP